MKNEKHKVNSLVKRVCLVLSLLTPGSSMMVIASDEIAIVQQTGNITVTGTVVDQTGEPVIGVNVLVKGSTNGTITDIDGKFSLKGVSPNSILTVSYIGYKTETVNLNGKKVLQIILKEDSEMLNEVVVVGYGTQKKVNMSGAVDAVSSKVGRKRLVGIWSEGKQARNRYFLQYKASHEGSRHCGFRVSSDRGYLSVR